MENAYCYAIASVAAAITMIIYAKAMLPRIKNTRLYGLIHSMAAASIPAAKAYVDNEPAAAYMAAAYLAAALLLIAFTRREPIHIAVAAAGLFIAAILLVLL